MKQSFTAFGAVVGITVLGLGGYVGRAAERRPNPAAAPVVVELFTSEGCSSCPPADALLARLQKEQPVNNVRVIALGQHVDYWDRLGWKDRFGSTEFSRRQAGYAARIGNDAVYTPQMVVDGTEKFVGSDASRARAAITRAAAVPKAKVSLLNGEDGNPFTVRASDVPAGVLTEKEKVGVFAAVVEDGLSSDVARGENSGRSLSHAAVVRRLQRVGTWDPSEKKEYRDSFLPEVGTRGRRVVVFLQADQSRRILGAAEALP